ncbi:MAG TPA: glycosyltransferase [Planctomycetes bacterium]|nr:glycosyltransferase [Planctomycetota bacterium]
MHIALTFPHSLGAPGGGTLDCTELARHLARAGAEVTLFAVKSLGPSRFPRPRLGPEHDGSEKAAELRAEGIDVRLLDPHPLHYLLEGRVVRRALARRIEEAPLDAVLGYWNETASLPSLLARHGILHALNAAASYGPMFEGSGAAWHRRIRTNLFIGRPLRAADLIFARSEFTKGELVRHFGLNPAKIRVAYLGIDPVFAAIPRASASPPEPLERILFLGNLVPEKGIFEALEALAPFADRPWRFRIGGWGDAEGVRSRAAALGLSEKIELLGRLDRPAVLEQLSWAQLALQPSHTESFGLANAEAQAAALPVVAYAVAAVPEVILDGETGWLAPLRSIEGLTACLARAFDDPIELRARGEAARKRIRTTFTFEETARVTLEAIEAGA